MSKNRVQKWKNVRRSHSFIHRRLKICQKNIWVQNPALGQIWPESINATHFMGQTSKNLFCWLWGPMMPFPKFSKWQMKIWLETKILTYWSHLWDLKPNGKFQCQKLAWKKMTRFRRAARTLYWDRPLWNQAQKFFMHMKIKIDPILGQNFWSHLAIFDIEVGVVFAVFDPLCPDALQQGPWPMVIRSTFGGLPNDPQVASVRVPGPVLGPLEWSHSKTGQIRKTWFIHPGVNILGKGVITYFCICSESNLGQ